MSKKQYTQPELSTIMLKPQNILVASDGQKMLDNSTSNGTVRYDDDDDNNVITKPTDIW